MTIWPWTYTDREAFNRHFMYNVGALTTNDSSYAQYLPRLLQASIPEGLTEGGSVPFTVNTVEYGGGTPDVTAQAQIVMLGGDGEVAVGEDGTLQGVREGQATFLVTYEYKGIDNMNYALTTQPLTVQVGAMATILPRRGQFDVYPLCCRGRRGAGCCGCGRHPRGEKEEKGVIGEGPFRLKASPRGNGVQPPGKNRKDPPPQYLNKKERQLLASPFLSQ